MIYMLKMAQEVKGFSRAEQVERIEADMCYST